MEKVQDLLERLLEASNKAEKHAVLKLTQNLFSGKSFKSIKENEVLIDTRDKLRPEDVCVLEALVQAQAFDSDAMLLVASHIRLLDPGVMSSWQ